ncbi:MAG: TRAP transporter small permease [Mailhella sp.]|nr:TRAP transporter small permease [Mailhella sp.]
MSESEIKTADAKKSSGALAFQIFCALIFLGMIGMVFTNAVLRYAFNSGYPPSEEWARFFFIYITFFGAIEAFYRKKMIAVELITDMLQGVSRKTVAVLAHCATIIALAIMLVGGITYVEQTFDTYAVATHINMTWINITLPIMAAASMLLQLRDLFGILRTPAAEFRKAEK